MTCAMRRIVLAGIAPHSNPIRTTPCDCPEWGRAQELPGLRRRAVSHNGHRLPTCCGRLTAQTVSAGARPGRSSRPGAPFGPLGVRGAPAWVAESTSVERAWDGVWFIGRWLPRLRSPAREPKPSRHWPSHYGTDRSTQIIRRAQPSRTGQLAAWGRWANGWPALGSRSRNGKSLGFGRRPLYGPFSY